MRIAKPRPRRPSTSLGPEPKDIAIPPIANTSSTDCARRVSPVDGTQPFSLDRTRSTYVGVKGSRNLFSHQRLMPLVRSDGLVPARFYSLPPQGSASTNSATSAILGSARGLHPT